ncbi:LYR family protein [Metarhizium album ARSEF 1941]|uniref:LYR family protein n=1 Tax=Metarhizium album (strain ARSEF 1941) TaxID=1081103 RepID=A0A0B2X6E6_METAS|nr:LYR family protein [Metarhizium album ARSEF 1941]KHO01308.1 LYR family protein [Metarhizium album ARSEF 1941]
MSVQDPRKVQELVQKGLRELQAMKVFSDAMRQCPALRVGFGLILIVVPRQRQTVIGQFYQLDRLVVEGGISVRSHPDAAAQCTVEADIWQGKDTAKDGQVVRQKEQGRELVFKVCCRAVHVCSAMAPGTRRANRSGYAEHDDFEGLPVRQWRQEWVNVAPPLPQEPLQQNDVWAIELLHGMPKDSALLAPHSQELLRAARSGQLYKRPAPAEEEEAEAEVAQAAEKNEKKEEETTVKGFSIKLWKQIPRNSEGSGLSYLAKRRKGTVTIASKTVEDRATGPTITRATVRRIDAAGNPYTEEVTLAEGQQVVGEIISTRVETASAPAAEAFVTPVPPLRRRPPPPKRKSKAGPGRGKKKIKNPLPGEGQPLGVASAGGGAATSVRIEGQGENGINQEGVSTSNPDSEMADADEDDEDEEVDDGEDGEDEDQEDGDHQGDNTDDSKIQDEEMTDILEELKPPSSSKPAVDATDDMTQAEVVPPSPLTLAPPLVSLATSSPKPEGSPLKNVMLQSPTEVQGEQALPPAVSAARAFVPEPTSMPNIARPPSLELDQSRMADVESKVESMIAEPPSTAAGDEETALARVDIPMGEAPTEASPKMDVLTQQGRAEERLEAASLPKIPSPEVSLTKEALLPPPPEQVGNISSPKADDGQDRASDSEERSRASHHSELAFVSERPPLQPHDSMMTEDTIKPEDSASVRFPLTESGAPSEVGTASVEDTKDAAVRASEPTEEQQKENWPPKDVSALAETKEDTPPLVNAHPELERSAEPEASRENMSKEAASPRPDAIVTETSHPEVSLPVSEPELVSQATKPTPPAPMPEVSQNEPELAPKAPDETSPGEATAQEADTPMREPKAEQGALEQMEPVKEEAKDEVKYEPMQEPTIEPAPEPKPVDDVSAQGPKVPSPPATEPAAADTTRDPQRAEAEAEAEEKKVDQPADAQLI